jgi:hypothetical protein
MDPSEERAMSDGQNELLDQVAAACRVASTVLPRGGRGVEAALVWLQAFPAACRLGLGDLTDSAPGLFRRFVAAGLVPSCPSDGAMTGAIRLIAAVSPLVTGRSPRTWTAWMGSALDPESPTAAALRGAVTPAMRRTPAAPATAPRRVGSIRAERDRLAAALADHEREQRTAAERIAALTLEHEQSVSDLRAAREQHERHAERLTTERDRLTADLHTAATRQRSCDAELTRTAAALADARKTHAGLRSELDEATRVARTSGEQAQASTRARDKLQAELDQQKRRADVLANDLAAASLELEDQAAYCHELTAEHDVLRAALERQDELLETARATLAREKAAHAETRRLLQDAERRGLTYIQERDALRTAAEAHEEVDRAIVEICKWIDIDPDSSPETNQRLEAILTAIDHQQTTHRRFVDRVEQLLLKQHYELTVARFETECYRKVHPDATISSAVEKARPEIRERSGHADWRSAAGRPRRAVGGPTSVAATSIVGFERAALGRVARFAADLDWWHLEGGRDLRPRAIAAPALVPPPARRGGPEVGGQLAPLGAVVQDPPDRVDVRRRSVRLPPQVPRVASTIAAIRFHSPSLRRSNGGGGAWGSASSHRRSGSSRPRAPGGRHGSPGARSAASSGHSCGPASRRPRPAGPRT